MTTWTELIVHEPYASFCRRDQHCYWHGVDEPGPGYLGCGECGHLYRTAGELRRAYRRKVLARPGFDISWCRLLWRAVTVRAKQITFCQHCIHDF